MTRLIISAFAVSSSIDNLGVGMSYGIRKIYIRLGANLVMTIICFLMSMGGITFGVWLSAILPGMIPLIFGVLLLIIIGLRVILLAKPNHKEPTKENNSMKGILKNPEAAIRIGSFIVGQFGTVLSGVIILIIAFTAFCRL